MYTVCKCLVFTIIMLHTRCFVFPNNYCPVVFQGQIVNHTLTLLSSFSNTLKLVSVKPYPLNDQFSFEPVSSEMLLLPNERVQVCAVNS